MTKIHRPPQKTAPFAEFDKLMVKLTVATDSTISSAMELMGYAGNTFFGWSKADEVPVVALNAIKGVLSDLGMAEPAQSPFSTSQLLAIFTLTIGEPVTHEISSELRQAVIAELGRVAK